MRPVAAHDHQRDEEAAEDEEDGDAKASLIDQLFEHDGEAVLPVVVRFEARVDEVARVLVAQGDRQVLRRHPHERQGSHSVERREAV